MTFEAIEDVAGLRAVRGTWTDIVAAGPTPSPCLTWEWAYAWWRHYGTDDARRRLAVLVAYHGGEAAAILPAFTSTSDRPGVRLRSLQFLGTPHESGAYLAPVQRDPDRPGMTAVLLREACRRWTPDRLALGSMLASDKAASETAAWARAEGHICRTTPTAGSPYLPLTGTWLAYEAGLDSELRRRTRRFFERPGAAFDWVQDPAEVTDAVDTLFTLHARRFAAKGARTGFIGPRRRAFHALLSQLFFERDILRLFRLTVHGRTVAIQYCFEHAGQLFYYQGGMDPDWSRTGAGAVLTGQVIRYAFDRGLTLFDFMRGTQTYKFQWTSHVRELVQLDVGVTMRGRLAAAMPGFVRRLRS